VEQIIRDMSKPDEDKVVRPRPLPSHGLAYSLSFRDFDFFSQIKPVGVGGVAGGEKFMTQTLFFKFARDSVELKLYDGDEWAQKAAEHEVP
jgi:hypothetical protein